MKNKILLSFLLLSKYLINLFPNFFNYFKLKNNDFLINFKKKKNLTYFQFFKKTLKF